MIGPIALREEKNLGRVVMSVTPEHRMQRRFPGQPGLQNENMCQEAKTKMKQEEEKGDEEVEKEEEEEER